MKDFKRKMVRRTRRLERIRSSDMMARGKNDESTEVIMKQIKTRMKGEIWEEKRRPGGLKRSNEREGEK